MVNPAFTASPLLREGEGGGSRLGMVEEIKVLKNKVVSLEEELRHVKNTMENNIEMKVKQEMQKAMINIKTVLEIEVESKTRDINQKIEEEVVKRMRELENNPTPAAAPADPRKPYKCPECNWWGKNQGVVKTHVKKCHK